MAIGVLGSSCWGETRRGLVYSRVGERVLGALAAAGSNLRQASVEGRADGAGGHTEQGGRLSGSPGNTYVAALPTAWASPASNAGPDQGQVAVLIRAAKTDRDGLVRSGLLRYFGGLRVSDLVSLTWGQVIRREARRSAQSSARAVRAGRC